MDHRTGAVRRAALRIFWGRRSRGQGGDRALPPDFGQNVNPICTRGTVTPSTLLLAPLDIQTSLRPCSCDFANCAIVSPSLTPFGCQVFHLVLIYLLY